LPPCHHHLHHHRHRHHHHHPAPTKRARAAAMIRMRLLFLKKLPCCIFASWLKFKSTTCIRPWCQPIRYASVFSSPQEHALNKQKFQRSCLINPTNRITSVLTCQMGQPRLGKFNLAAVSFCRIIWQ
jgi:hypothetical protein